MDDIDSRCASLRAQIVTVEKQLGSLKRELEDAEKTATILASRNGSQTSNCKKEDLTNTNKWPLLPEEYKRYGRQMIVSEIGIHGLCGVFLIHISFICISAALYSPTHCCVINE
jgi:adenylyltransferase and sulfurtransferase